MALMTVAMMVAMMLPSVAPTLWRYHHHLRATRTPNVWRQTSAYAFGYASVWMAVCLTMCAINARLPAFVPSALGAVVVCAGAVQLSRWKTTRLRRCREACVAPVPTNVTAAWRDGCRFGVDCTLSCSAPMAVLLVAGLMDIRVMLVVTAVITAERVAPAGVRIARLTGVAALALGLAMCV